MHSKAGEARPWPLWWQGLRIIGIAYLLTVPLAVMQERYLGIEGAVGLFLVLFPAALFYAVVIWALIAAAKSAGTSGGRTVFAVLAGGFALLAIFGLWATAFYLHLTMPLWLQSVWPPFVISLGIAGAISLLVPARAIGWRSCAVVLLLSTILGVILAIPQFAHRWVPFEVYDSLPMPAVLVEAGTAVTISTAWLLMRRRTDAVEATHA